MHEADEPPSEPPDRKDSLATIRAAIHGKAARRREAADVNELVSDFGFLSVFTTFEHISVAYFSLIVPLTPRPGTSRLPQLT